MINKRKSFLGYTGFAILFLLIIFLGLKLQSNLYSNSRETYEVFPYYLFSAIFPIVIGIFLALPHFFKTFPKTGKWTVNWAKLIVVGFPFMYLSIFPILYYSEILTLYLPFSSYILGGYFGRGATTSFETITGIVTGYIVCTSIIKK